MIVSRSIPAPPPEVNLANYLILNYDPLRPSDSVVLTSPLPAIVPPETSARRIFTTSPPRRAAPTSQTVRCLGTHYRNRPTLRPCLDRAEIGRRRPTRPAINFCGCIHRHLLLPIAVPFPVATVATPCNGCN